MLTTEQARRYYDGFGSKQDSQGWYEDAAIGMLVERARFEQASAVFELGCGTGRVAASLLAERLPPAARYLGIDVSSTMVELAGRRLASFGPRAEVRLADGSPRVEAAAGSFDRVFSTYVLDLLPEAAIERWLAEAQRLLAPGGLLCLVSLTNGVDVPSRTVAWLWGRVHALSARLVGGCRPIELVPFVSDGLWTVRFRRVVTAWGVPSEVLVASRNDSKDG